MLRVDVQRRFWQALLIVATVGLSWLLMMAVHELGHVIHVWLSGGQVQRVVLQPFSISRTDVSPNPHPQFVAWGGAIWGVVLPLVLLVLSEIWIPRFRFLLAFFAGFCCIANGLYLAAGSLTGAGDAGDLLGHGAAQWQLILFGLPACALGLWLWNGLGPSFGLGRANGNEIAETDNRRFTFFLVIALGVWVVFTALVSAR